MKVSLPPLEWLRLLAVVVVLSSCDSSTEPVRRIPPLPPPTHVAIDQSFSWSRDGSSIVYLRTLPSTEGPPGIYMVGTDGANNRLIIESTAAELRLAPGGTKLAIVRGGDVHVLDLASGEVEQIADGSVRRADWSPDGRRLVVTGTDGRDGGIRIVDIETGSIETIRHQGRIVYAPEVRWSPTSDWIAYEGHYTDGRSEIFVITPDGAEARRLTNAHATGGGASRPRWIEQGRWILYQWKSNRGRARENRVVDLDGRGRSAPPVLVEYLHAISPGGRYAALVARAPGDTTTAFGLPAWVLHIRRTDDTDGGSLRPLVEYRRPTPTPSAPKH